MIRHITLPKGFRAAGTTCGIKASGKPDLAIIAGEADCSAAIVTTQNQIVGAPIQWVRSILPSGRGKVRAFVVNSGCSNVCTGKAGLRDAETMAKRTARQLDTTAEKVLVASTGVIGQRLPIGKITAGIDDAGGKLSTRNDAMVMRAMMTTDTRPKTAVVKTHIGGSRVAIAGIAKGAGMIAPSMATMISPVTTDLAISPTLLRKALREVVRTTYNAVTVDSDTSTSDIVAILASGAAGNKSVKAGSADYRKFLATLREVCGELSRAIAADGEGATRLIEVTVSGARNDADAEAAAKSVADSPLFKTAVHGGDPNWGRIAMALGKSSATVRAETLRIRIGGVLVFSNGTGRAFNVARVEEALQQPEVRIEADLGLGKGHFTALTCDLSREYIALNADYTT
ncbi:MAG: bifunctional glutamate N-acetyltransferase/amino-acid acetyltransferase ArgJ [Planctomycetes bacterium]|jgi:glutamate N-acetyltransferase/amino-acid N-acetyltransferase|nr:bifunctional glutamate N-acetyltransferase/amino-acid acetyltransferase ArgJ [Phycisphaerae bacterium]NBB94258.1 bifunctional glutamate N-acetyltransferase/amino-acid acetyltransferase ArgJ [Planctomycetota bacterium]